MAEQSSFRASSVYNAASDTFDSPALSFWSHYGKQTVDRLGLAPGAKVLDVACGTGSSAIPAAMAVGEHGAVTGVDAADRMLDVARAKALKAELTNIGFINADMTALNFPDRAFDAVICVFGVFFARDMQALVTDLWRLVAPGGKLSITVWGNGRFEPLASVFSAAVNEARPDLPVSSEPWRRIGAPELLSDMLTQAGVENVEVDSGDYEVSINSPDDWWTIIMGSGSRWKMDALTSEEAESVRGQVNAFIADQRITSVPTTAIYGIGQKTYQ